MARVWFVIDRVTYGTVLGAWTFVTSAAVLVRAQLGRWPRYGDPESWSSWPFVDHNGLYQVGFLLVVAGLLASPLCVVRALFSLRNTDTATRNRNATFALTSLAFVVLLWSDPLGAMNWFLD